uniref:Mediator of RNA polymerase II transcription subunit 28 n=1 Tax=Equus asinus TaxID=9793 RepID=A0A9L0JEL9_EQUAS
NVSCARAGCLPQRSPHPGDKWGNRLRERQLVPLVSALSCGRYAAQVGWQRHVNLTFLEAQGLGQRWDSSRFPAVCSRPIRFLVPSACFASLVSQDYVNGTDQEEIRTGVDQCIQKFLDIARQTECFFLQKRLQLSVQKPEQVIKEDVSELRNELQRKDTLVQKHLTKLRHWQQVLEDINVQHKKPADIPQGSLAYLEQASANIPAPMKQT